MMLHIGRVHTTHLAVSRQRRTAFGKPKFLTNNGARLHKHVFVVKAALEAGTFLEVDYYRILGLPKGSNREAVRQAYERARTYVFEPGVSPLALSARERLLRVALESLSNVDARRSYDQQGTHTIPMAGYDVAAALLLMQESGAYNYVITNGTIWLNQHKKDEQASSLPEAAADVALAVALARCDKAAADLSGSGERVTPAMEELKAAQVVLQQYNVPCPKLKQEIQESIQELAPRYALEKLSQPLGGGEGPSIREEPLALLRGYLWAPGRTAEEREECMKSARPWLTAGEQVSLYSSLPDDVDLTASELDDTALAFLAEGLIRQQPQLVKRAEEILASLAQGVLYNSTGVQDSVERSVCALLLGDPDRALQLLRLDGDMASADRDVRKFIQSNSADGSDPLPGLCALAETWLKEVLVPSFRDFQEGTVPADRVTLGTWFGSRWVQVYLQVSSTATSAHHQLGSWQLGRQLLDAAASGMNLLRGFASDFTGGAMAQRDSLAPGTVAAAGASRLASSSQTSDLSQVETSPGGRAREGEGYSPSTSYRTPAEGATGNGRRRLSRYSPPPLNLSVAEARELSGGKGEELPVVRLVRGLQGVSVGTGGGPRWLLPLITLTGVLGLALVISGVIRAVRGDSPQVAPLPSSGPSSVSRSPVSSHLALTPSSVKQLVMTWLSTKGEALGPRHDSSSMTSVLSGAMLKEWTEKSDQVRDRGYCWLFSGQDVKVTRLEPLRTPGSDGYQLAEVLVVEKGTMMRGDQVVDQYATSYNMEYAMEPTPQGWKIADSRKPGTS